MGAKSEDLHQDSPLRVNFVLKDRASCKGPLKGSFKDTLHWGSFRASSSGSYKGLEKNPRPKL